MSLVRFREIRRCMGLTQHELAEKIGVHQTLLSRWESGVSYPPLVRLFKISERLGLPVAALLNDDSTASDFADVAEFVEQARKAAEAAEAVNMK